MKSFGHLTLFASLYLWSAPLLGQPPLEESEATETAKRVYEASAREAKAIEIMVDGQHKCHLYKQPLLQWSNYRNKQVYGANYLWTHHEVPVAISSIYDIVAASGGSQMELVSLGRLPLTAVRRDEEIWTPPAGSVEFKVLPDAPKPASSTKARALQMRALARRFTADLASRYDDTDLAALRLMSKPLYTFQSSDDSGSEGALFAFVVATDPELLLLLKSEATATGRQWYYTAARLNFARLRLQYQGETVWDVPQVAPPWNKVKRPNVSYRIIHWPKPDHATDNLSEQ